MTKVLVIDDEESIRILLKVSLTHKGYEVILAEDGETGIEEFRRTNAEIVLTDLRMPGMDGMRVLKEIKRLNPDTRIIVITGHGEMRSVIEALRLEASDFINKPITDEALSIALKRAEEVLWLKHTLRHYTNNLESMVKEATEEVRAAHDFQKNLIESSIDGIVASDKDGVIVVFNEAAVRLTRYDADQVIGKRRLEEVFPPNVAATVKQELHGENHGGKGRLVNYESAIISKTGEQIPVRISGATLMENGAETGVVCFLQDLREIKRLQRELIENERISAMGQAVAGMAHHIKNILNGLQGGVYIVNTSMHRDKPDLLTKGWAMVQNNIAKISDLVMNMLVYSKEREPDDVPCSPNDIAQDVYELFKDRAARSNVKLITDFDVSLKECLLDPNAVHRSLVNLVSNAIDACLLDSTSGKDWTVIIRTCAEGKFVRFDVADNGMGMTKEVQEKLFGRFFSTKGGKGTGLGLLVTRKVVTESSGTITFTSEPCKGTVFTIRFPRRALDKDERREAMPSSAPSVAHEKSDR